MTDLKYAVRLLVRSPGFACSAILTLALGIGANSVIFTGVYRLLFDPMPFLADQDRLVAVYEVAPGGRNDHNEFTLGAFRNLRESAHGFESLTAHAWVTLNLTGQSGGAGGDRPERAQGMRVASNFFDTLGVRPLLGRTFLPGEDEPGHDQVVVLSHGLWMRRFGGDPSIVGRSIQISSVSRTVIGVMPEGVRYPAPGELWIPFNYTAQQWTNRRSHFLLVTGRLKPGVDVKAAQAEVQNISARLAASFPETNTGWGNNVRPLVADQTRMIRPMMLVLFAAVGFVLLIGCANVANLLLARRSTRQRELAIRAALGAGRGRLRLQLFIESLVVAFVGGLAGLLFCLWGVGALAALVPATQRRFISGFDRLAVDSTVVLFTLALSFITSLVFGVLPAIKAAGRNLLPALQERGRAFAGGDRHRLRKMLVVSEVALAVVLLIGAGLALRSFYYALSVDLGFEPDGVAVTSLVVPGAKYRTPQDVAGFYDRLMEEIAAIPGVRESGAANITPLCQCNETTSFQIEGYPPFERGKEPDVGYRAVTPGYFATMHIPLRAGRNFTTRDAIGQPQVVIVNETMARRFFGDRGPLGQRLRFGGPTTVSEIVGVVADVRHKGPGEPVQDEVYFPQAQAASNSATLVLRADGDPESLAASIREAVRRVDPDQPVYDQRTMRDVVNLAMGPFNFARQLLAAMALVALFLSAVGIYSVIAHVVAARSREIGIRIALGGTRKAVVRTVVAEAMMPALWGLGIGLAGSAAVTSTLGAALVGVQPIDPVTFSGAAAALLVAALLACYYPARRASRVDPVVTLRSE